MNLVAKPSISCYFKNARKLKECKINVDAELNVGKQYDLKVKNIGQWARYNSKNTERKSGIVKPTLKELMIKGFSDVDNSFKSVNKRLDNLEARVAKIEVSLEEVRSLPTIQKELVQSKAKSR